MRRLILISSAVAAFSLGGAAASAAPTHGLAVAAPIPAVTLVEGWWEQENHGDAADRYWQLNRTDRRRYDAAEARIQQRHKRYHLDQYDHRDDRDLQTEHRVLHYDRQ
jgi:hypothetical protein